MTQIFAAPGRYIQGYKELERLYRHIAWFGQRFLIITSQGRLDSLKQTLAISFDQPDLSLHYAVFDGEVTRAEVQRLAALQGVLDWATAATQAAGVPPARKSAPE